MYVATTADSRVQALDLRRQRIRVVYDAARVQDPVLTRVDALTVSPAGELFVCENSEDPNQQLCIVARDGRATAFCSIGGPRHAGSELTGVTFDPGGMRMYVGSQRSLRVLGEVYEVRGPFAPRT